ncbi:MAG: transposase [Spirochaetaceae bacterium]|nr:transposase [Spirochaetaceae bacterium]
MGSARLSPDVMLKIIFYCYSRGIITSRSIEYACKTNIIVKALARDAEPDHDTIAHFISSQAEAVKGLFAQVLLKCYALGLIGGELFAIDGCKLPSNAAKEWSGARQRTCVRR